MGSGVRGAHEAEQVPGRAEHGALAAILVQDHVRVHVGRVRLDVAGGRIELDVLDVGERCAGVGVCGQQAEHVVVVRIGDGVVVLAQVARVLPASCLAAEAGAVGDGDGRGGAAEHDRADRSRQEACVARCGRDGCGMRAVIHDIGTGCSGGEQRRRQERGARECAGKEGGHAHRIGAEASIGS